MGLGVVAWRTKGRAETARAIARTEAMARGASIELQLSQASTAAEVLGTLARQTKGGPRVLLGICGRIRATAGGAKPG